MDKTTLAYLAGAIDSDGCISIKKRTTHVRITGDAWNPSYRETVTLKQVTPQIPHLLREAFGGYCNLRKAANENSKPLWHFEVADRQAAAACTALLPYLRVKRAQAEACLKLREVKTAGAMVFGYWFSREHPEWRSLEMVTTSEAAAILGYTARDSVNQAIRNGSLLALPWDHVGRETPRIPRRMVEEFGALRGRGGRCTLQCPALVAHKEGLYQQVREMNKTGVNGTAIYHKTGYHARADGDI